MSKKAGMHIAHTHTHVPERVELERWMYHMPYTQQRAHPSDAEIEEDPCCSLHIMATCILWSLIVKCHSFAYQLWLITNLRLFFVSKDVIFILLFSSVRHDFYISDDYFYGLS